MAMAHRTARAGPENVASTPSPVPFDAAAAEPLQLSLHDVVVFVK